MPNKKHIYLTRKEQSKIKPKIEDIIPEVLDGDMKKTALEFVAYMSANNMPFKWSSLYGWYAGYKGKGICEINLNVENSIAACGRPGVPPAWIILPCCDHMSQYEETIITEGLQRIFWDGVSYCMHSAENSYAGQGCKPDSWCAGGNNDITIAGKNFNGVCHYHKTGNHPKVWEPDEAMIKNIKRLLELEQKARDEIIVPNFNLLKEEDKQAVLEFIGYIKSGKLPFKNGVCKYKGKSVVNIEINHKGDWQMILSAQYDAHFKELISNEPEEIKAYIEKNIYLRSVPLEREPPCGGCMPEVDRNSANKEYKNICAFVNIRMTNPDENLREFAKKLIMLRHDAVLNGRVPNCNYIKPADRV